MPEMISPFSFHCTIEWQLVSLQIINVPPTLPPSVFFTNFFSYNSGEITRYIRCSSPRKFHTFPGATIVPRSADRRAPLPSSRWSSQADPCSSSRGNTALDRRSICSSCCTATMEEKVSFEKSKSVSLRAIDSNGEWWIGFCDYIQGREGKNNKLRGSNDDNWWTIVDATIA